MNIKVFVLDLIDSTRNLLQNKIDQKANDIIDISEYKLISPNYILMMDVDMIYDFDVDNNFNLDVLFSIEYEDSENKIEMLITFEDGTVEFNPFILIENNNGGFDCLLKTKNNKYDIVNIKVYTKEQLITLSYPIVNDKNLFDYIKNYNGGYFVK